MRYGSRESGRERAFHSRWSRPTREALYRARDGVFLGVCKGVARHFDVPVNMLRAVVLILFFVTGVWPVGLLYLIAAMIMRVEPAVPFANEDERTFYDAYANSRTGVLQRMKRSFDNLDRRLRRMEAVVTSRDFDWERRMRDS
ncbi:MAG: envelope stress response membrane protein PspC [Desulfomicrobium sp.]|nr:envelope stress response membrane protein PspC [Desulfomicrobium sp.]MDP3429865.1 envelope stress response membrane protein PspC [Desulfomicrobium sp.]